MDTDSDPRPAPRARVGTVRDRRGRGLATPLLPPTVPAFRTRAQLFDQLVMSAVADLQPWWHARLSMIEFAVDDVPLIPSDSVTRSDDVVDDDGVPLSRFMAPGVDARGRATKARIIVYRHPLQMRSVGQADLLELVTEVLGEQLAAVFGDNTGDDGTPGE